MPDTPLVFMLILSIESSCDETAAAVVRNGTEVLSNIVASQVADHAVFGGVVPEIASRKHLELVAPVVGAALREAGVGIDAIEGVAVTRGPGLIGALLVGVSAAKGIAYARRIPLAGINHIEGHIFASFLERRLDFPFLALVVSGGHSHLYEVRGFGSYRTLGQTLDDAAGEAFDKVAKIVGLGYPGGVLVDRLAASGNPAAFRLPRPLSGDGTFNFSFSGLKTAVLNLWRKVNHDGNAALEDLAASFQAAVCDVLAEKTAAALDATGIRRLVVAGGVACNSGLRARIGDLCRERGVDLTIPRPALCTDNAAMLAVVADDYLTRFPAGDPLSLDACAVWPLDGIDRGEGA